MSTSFPTQRLGATDMRITRVGFGAWAIGGPGWSVGWGAQDDGESIRAIRHAVNRGINWIDTAAVYGLGHSESLVGRALAGMPPSERPYVFTKGGLVGSPADPMAAAPYRRPGQPAARGRGVVAQARRRSHRSVPDALAGRRRHALEVYWQALLDLRQAGKVRHVGLSNHNLAQVQAAEQLGHVETLQPPFSAIRRESAADLLPWCASHDTGVIVYSPMQSGLLSGAFSAERAAALPEGDWRARNAEFMAPRLAANLEFADALKPIAQHHGASVGAIAVAWALAWPGVTGAIAGARSAEQVDGWLGAATLELDSDDMRQIADALARTGVGGGPCCRRPTRRRLR